MLASSLLILFSSSSRALALRRSAMKVTRPRIGGVLLSFPLLNKPPELVLEGTLSRAIVVYMVAVSLRLGSSPL